MGFGAGTLMVAHRTGKAVGDGEPHRQQDVQGNESQQAYLHNLNQEVGAHEMTEG